MESILKILALVTPEIIMQVALATPLVGMGLIYLFRKTQKIRESITILTSIFTFINVYQLFIIHTRGITVEFTLFHINEVLSIAFEITPLGMIFAFIASFLWMITSIYAIGYMRANKEKDLARFFMMFAISIFAALGIAFASNLLTLFIFYELLTLATYPLVTHQRDDESRKSGRVYLGILMGTSICLLLPAIIITYYLTGTLNFSQNGIFIGHNVSKEMIALLLFLFAYGIGKSALMPMHRWLPAAMVAPTPVSALLHAVAVVKAGVFCVLQIAVNIFGFDLLVNQVTGAWWQGSWIVYIAGFTIMLASLVALKQDNLKKRLAYSTISQLSYVILATYILSKYSIIAAAFHIAAHAFSKITLFFAAGSIYTASKKKYVSQLDGIGKRMPWTMAAFTIGALSMIGFPPTAGFLSKWYLLNGALDRELWFAVMVMVVSTILNAAYFLPIIYAAFFKKETVILKEHEEAPHMVVYPLFITAMITVWLFFMPDIFMVLSRVIVP